MIRSIIAFSISVLAISIFTNRSFADNHEYLSDRKTGCKIAGSFDSDVPEPREIEWSGNCADGLAEGHGIVTFFSDNQPYWRDDYGEKSGITLKGGKPFSNIDPKEYEMFMPRCEHTLVHPVFVSVGVPRELNVISEANLMTIVTLASRRIDDPVMREKMDCSNGWKKGVYIFKKIEGKWMEMVELVHNPDIKDHKDYPHFRVGNETWYYARYRHVELTAALREKQKVLKEVAARQRERLAEQQRAERLAKLEAEKREKQRRAEWAKRVEREKAQRRQEEAERRQKELELRVAELQQLAEADASERDRARPADSWCFFSCDPTEKNGRLVLINKLDRFFETPAIVTTFRKTNGVSGSLGGFETYELHFEANVELPQGFMVPNRDTIAGMIGGANAMGLAMRLKGLMEYTDLAPREGKKWSDPFSLAGKGRILFRKTEQGWEGEDGVIYTE